MINTGSRDYSAFPLIRQNFFDEESAKMIARKILDTYDTNRTGAIERNEVGQMISDSYSIFKRQYVPFAGDEQSFITTHDKDGNGTITLADLERICVSFLCEGPLATERSTNTATQLLAQKIAANTVSHHQQPQGQLGETIQSSGAASSLISTIRTANPPLSQAQRPAQQPSSLSFHDSQALFDQLKREVEMTKGSEYLNAVLADATSNYLAKKDADNYLTPTAMSSILATIYQKVNGREPTAAELAKVAAAQIYSISGKQSLTELQAMALLVVLGKF